LHFAVALVVFFLLPFSPLRADGPSQADQQDFEILVVGPDKKPISDAAIELRTLPPPTQESFFGGQFVRKTTYGAFATTDRDGQIGVKLPTPPKNLLLIIKTPGYGAYAAQWTPERNSQPRPAHFTAELEAAWSAGGIVVDSEGNPIEGAEVFCEIALKKPPGEERQLTVAHLLKIDAAGKWHFDSVPESVAEIRVWLSHPEFLRREQMLPREDFAIPPGAQPTQTIVLERGLTISGKVADEAGNPMVGALVRTKSDSDIREATTGEDGSYRLKGCKPQKAKVVVSASGKATDMVELSLDKNQDGVDFQLHPGGTVRIKVLDAAGNPVPKARISFQHWRAPTFDNFELSPVNQFTNRDGVWDWHEAPLDAFQVDIVPPNGMQLQHQILTARTEEYVFRTCPALVITGNVVDAETKQPIKQFQIIPGLRNSPTQLTWQREGRTAGTDGKYQLRHNHEEYLANVIQVEAPGYLPATSRDIKSDEGNVTVDFELQKTQNLTGLVIMPQGKPAVGAKVAIGSTQARFGVRDGELQDFQPNGNTATTDQQGRFEMAPLSGAIQVVVTHSEGYTEFQSADGLSLETIQLNPWAKVDGVFRIGQKPIAHAVIDLNLTGQALGSVRSLSTNSRTTTDHQGHFTFDRVLPGDSRIGPGSIQQFLDGEKELKSRLRIGANLSAGQTTHLDIGGTGRPVTGQIEPPGEFNGKVDWHSAELVVRVYVPELPRPEKPPLPADIAADPAKSAAWMNQWQQTDAGKVWTTLNLALQNSYRRQIRGAYFTVNIDRDGKFRIDDVPADEYSLSVRFNQNLKVPGNIQNYRFTVPTMKGDRSDDPLDLGILTLQNP